MNAIQFDEQDGSVVTETTLDEPGLTGAAARLCTTPSPFLKAEDNPGDGGQQIFVDWISFVPPGNLTKYEVFRSEIEI